jgi:CheY-like chemotaxis protein
VTPDSIDAGKSRTVLVVDDDSAVRLLCRANLEGSGFRVVEAADGDEAVAQVHAERPDAILLDIMMPRLSGWEVAGTLLRDRATDAIPIIFISALTGPDQRMRALELGAVGYVTKPFDPTSLGPTVNELLDRIERGERSAVIAEKLETLRAEVSGS